MNKFDIFMQWLRDVGGTYQTLHDIDPPNPKRAKYQPAHKPVLRPLNPKFYRTDSNGVVRKLSKKSLGIAENFDASLNKFDSPSI